jgi:hypothetical protein
LLCERKRRIREPGFEQHQKKRLKAQGTGHKENFEFGIWNFEIKESQPTIRNYLAMLKDRALKEYHTGVCLGIKDSYP